MKHLLFLPLMSLSMMPAARHLSNVELNHPPLTMTVANNPDEGFNLSAQPEPGAEKMSAAVFKAQKFCRAELKDFEFDARFSIVSVSVYFAGVNFQTAAKGTLNSSSLEPIRSLMARCVPGTIVIFDDVKVKGPDNEVRTIPGVSLVLR